MKIIFYSLIALILAGCGSGTFVTKIIRIKGSDTMLQMTEMLAEVYMEENPGISIYVEGGGTGSGINALINNTVDICTASRRLNSDEVKSLAEKHGTLGIYYLVAKDALSIYVNPDNPVQDFKLDELQAIFSGKIKSWKELGGNDSPISLIIRPPNSGTNKYFKDLVLKEESYSKNVTVKGTSNEIINEIKNNKDAIGYGGIGYNGGILHAKVEGITPTEKNAREDIYPITRYLHFFVLDSPEKNIKNFLDWVLSPEGQNIVKKSGYIPLWQKTF